MSTVKTDECGVEKLTREKKVDRKSEEDTLPNEIEMRKQNDSNPEATQDRKSDDVETADQGDGTGDANVSKNSQSAGKLSKNQLKRQRKLERAMEVKKRRKMQEKETKVAKAKAEGRDLESERKDMEHRREKGNGWARRNEYWLERFQKNKNSFQICIDCSFDHVMSAKELNSLASQIRYCYASNKRANHPVHVKVTSLGGATFGHLQHVSGFDQWHHRAFEHTDKSVEEAYPDKSKLVYLTSDSDTVLNGLEEDKIYIIGGIVDRNRLKRAAFDRAKSLGIATAKLPISEYLNMVTTKVLAVNHVFEILLKHRECGNDWKKAFLDVLPTRKDVTPKDSD